MKLNDTARLLIGSNPATLVTVNRDGSPQISVVWIVVQSTADGDDELVPAHLQEHEKILNIRRDPRVAVTFVSTDRSGPFTPYLSIKGTARVEEGGAPELLKELNTAIFAPGTNFPPPDASPRVSDSTHNQEGRRRRALGILTAETAVVDEPAPEAHPAAKRPGSIARGAS